MSIGFTDCFDVEALIVNKDGKEGVITLVADDGKIDLASRYAANFLDKYKNIQFSFANMGKSFATLVTERDENGKLVYKMDENGKYVYEVLEEAERDIAFWRNMLLKGRCEIVCHTMTHAFWGLNDDGGVFKYVDKNGEVRTSDEMPVGSVTKELLASKQILEELFGIEIKTLVNAGIGVPAIDKVVDGVEYITYNRYYSVLLKRMIEDGVYITARNTFSNSDINCDYVGKGYVNFASDLKVLPNRRVKAWSINDYGDDISQNVRMWSDYIDAALESNGWACFCIHNMNGKDKHYITEEHADELFAYVDSLCDRAWIATLTDASKYYCEWSTANVGARYEDNKITVSLTDEENDEIFDMALTVKVTVPAMWENAKFDGEQVEIHTDDAGVKFVYVDILPNSAEHIIE